MRSYREFTWKDTNLKVACSEFELVTQVVVEQRKLLEQYIRRQPLFQTSLTPISLEDNAPEIAKRMAAAASLTGLGPMASVAGTLAQFGVEAAMAAGCREAIVENGGDMFLISDTPITIGIYAGENLVGANLAFLVKPEELPLAFCSSSSRMGHSLSFGTCELATVVAKEAALADSVATLTCNLIQSDSDIAVVLDDVGAIPGIRGILAVKNGKIGLWGDLPDLVRNEDATLRHKITRDQRSGFRE